MRTWSAESLFVKAYSFAAVCVQGVLDAVGTIEQVTRPPRLGHDLDVVDGAEQLAERDTHLNGLADFFLSLGCGRDMESYAEGFNEGFAEAQRQEREHPNEYEPALDDAELRAVRNLLTAADGTSFATLHEVAAWWRTQDPSSTSVLTHAGGEGPAGSTHSPESPAGHPYPARLAAADDLHKCLRANDIECGTGWVLALVDGVLEHFPQLTKPQK